MTSYLQKQRKLRPLKICTYMLQLEQCVCVCVCVCECRCVNVFATRLSSQAVYFIQTDGNALSNAYRSSSVYFL